LAYQLRPSAAAGFDLNDCLEKCGEEKDTSKTDKVELATGWTHFHMVMLVLDFTVIHQKQNLITSPSLRESRIA
jgi:hypothetical protein